MFDESRLHYLVTAFFDCQLDAAEKHELESMLLASSRARQIYLEQAEWHGLTREWALRSYPLEIISLAPSSPRKRYIGVWLAAGLAACVALMGGLYLFRARDKQPSEIVESPRPDEVQDVAMLGHSSGVIWEAEQATLRTGSPLPKGWLRLREGTLRLDFYNGARVILQGPAALELISPDLARLDHGTLSAMVPPSAEGFTITNGNLRIVDRGTEFGVRAQSPGSLDIHVFDGAVELAGKIHGASPRQLGEGDALAIRPASVTRSVADRSVFPDPVTLNREEVEESKFQRKAWVESSKQFQTTRDLIVYYDFEDLEPSSYLVPNLTPGSSKESFATMIGGERLAGRWDENTSIGFSKTSDRVRFRTSGTLSSLTMMAWVRIDSLRLDHNSLFSMSADQIGEIHWKFDRSGKMLLGLRASSELDFGSWERLESPTIVSERDLGRWMHLASVIDGERMIMKHFVDGIEVTSGVIQRRTPIQLGLANLGNFDPASPERARFGTGRSFNGRIDEFAIIGRAMSSEEIRKAAK
jgi:hypothetical protein